jgi:hypothetical protein
MPQAFQLQEQPQPGPVCAFSWCRSPSAADAVCEFRLCAVHRGELEARPGYADNPLAAWLVYTSDRQELAHVEASKAKRAKQAADRAAGKVSEKSVLRSVVRALEKLEGIKVMRQQVQLVEVDGRKMSSGEVGAADLIVFVRLERQRQSGGVVRFPTALALECKATTGKQSPAQVKWQARWERDTGGLYRIVRSAAEALAAVEDARALRTPGSAAGAAPAGSPAPSGPTPGASPRLH